MKRTPIYLNTIPDSEYVIGVINRPPYTPESYILLTASCQNVAFDVHRFETLTKNLSQNS